MEGSRSKIIIVDDNISNLDIAKAILSPFYQVYPVPSSAKLFELLENFQPDLILLDIDMPEENGYETIKKLKSNPSFYDIPVIFLTAMSDEKSELEGFELGAVDYVTKPFSGPLLLKRIEKELLIMRQKKDLLDYSENLEQKVSEKTREVVNLQNAVLETVSDLVEFRDEFTGGHIERTQRYLKALTEALLREGVYADEVSNWDMKFFVPSAQLHDVGKIAISDSILNKPAKLSPEEFDIMKNHVAVGIDAIEKIMQNTEKHAFLDHALQITGTHHEKWDGTGYPKKLKGNEIPLEGRLMAIADVYDALISARPYKKPFTHAQACQMILEGAGTHFDPALVEVFKTVMDEFDNEKKLTQKKEA